MSFKDMEKKIVVENPSKSNPRRKPYETVMWDDGTFSCDCPAWIFAGQKGGERTCKHINDMKTDKNVLKKHALKAS